jgi:hypothetical protein
VVVATGVAVEIAAAIVAVAETDAAVEAAEATVPEAVEIAAAIVRETSFVIMNPLPDSLGRGFCF